MTPEQREALRRYLDGSCYWSSDIDDNRQFFDKKWRDDDRQLLEEFLSEHPADEDVLIDENWVAGHGLGELDLNDAWSAFLKRIEPSEGGPLNITRGDASRLLRVLGIELKE